MDIQVEELDYCKMQVSCTYESEEIDKKKKEILKIFKTAPIPGFRKGKATAKVIQNYYHSQIQDSLKKALAEEALHQSMFEKQYKPLSAPQFKMIFLQPNKFTCQFVVDKAPDFDLADISDMQVPSPPQEKTQDQYVQEVLQSLRVSYGDKQPFIEDDVTQMGDVVSITYQATVDGQEVAELSSTAEGEIITLGSSRVEGFDENLLQMKVGDTREFTLSIPSNNLSNFSGKPVTFKVSLNMAMRVTPCPLDDTLAAKLNKPSFDELSKEVHAMAFAQLENQHRAAKQNAVVGKLLSMHQFNIPNWLSVREAEYLASSARVEWNSLSEEAKAQYVSQAERNVRLSLVLEKIRESDPEAQLSDQEAFNAVYAHLSKSADRPVEELMQDLNKLGYLQVLYSRIKDDYTMNYLVKKTTFVE